MQWLKSHGRLIWEFANGIENSPVRQDFPVKGIGNSSTLPFDIEDRKTGHRALLSLTETVAMRLRDIRKSAGVLSVSIKDRDFQSCSHQGNWMCLPIQPTSYIRLPVNYLMKYGKGNRWHLGVRGFLNYIVMIFISYPSLSRI